jgi:DNA-binding response OmpR family regulator
VNLPDINGIALLKEIRAKDRAVPVLLVTVVDRAQPAFDARALGANDYVTKPFDENDLVGRIKRALAEAKRAGHPSTEAFAGVPYVLFVEPDVGARAALVVSLRRDYRIQAFPSMSPAVDELARTAPDVVVIRVTRRDGKPAACLATLRSRFPTGPVILITSDGIEHREFQGYGVIAVLQDPLDFEALTTEFAALFPSAARPSTPRRFSRRTSRTIQRVARVYPTATVASLSKDAYVSETHLSRSFRAEVGMSLKNFIVRVRIEAAKYLLRESGAKASDIASTVGLYDGAHLSRMFARYGVGRPGQFR